MALETWGAIQMIITWGDDLLDTTQGLDILGVRGIDQAVEQGLVNGITTISQRARYLSILPWALGEYLVDHASEGFDWDSLTVYLRRVEFMTLAASRLDSELNGADAIGALGANLHQERLAALINGGTVTFPDDSGGAMLGTYFAPCRTIGLLVDGDDAVPYRLSPRGREIWKLRKERLPNSPAIEAISSGGEISRTLAEAAIPEFSLGSLALSSDESQLLYYALVTLWDPETESERTRVANAYDAFNGTIACPRDLLTLLLEGVAERRDMLSALAIEQEILKLCHERQLIVTGIFETEAQLRALRAPKVSPTENRSPAVAATVPSVMRQLNTVAAKPPASATSARKPENAAPAARSYRRGSFQGFSIRAGGQVPLPAGISALRCQRIGAIQRGMARGAGLGRAMALAGHGFPDPALVPVAAALDGAPGWEDKLARFVERWVGRSEDLLKSRAAALNGALLIVVTLAMAAGIDAMFSVLQQAGRS